MSFLHTCSTTSHLKPAYMTFSGTKRCCGRRYLFLVAQANLPFSESTLSVQEDFTYTCCNVSYAIMCRRCGMMCTGETGLHLGDGFGQQEVTDTGLRALLAKRTSRKTGHSCNCNPLLFFRCAIPESSGIASYFPDRLFLASWN